MSRPSVGSSSTSSRASMAITRARWSWVTMPLDNSLTLLSGRIEVLVRKASAFARSKRGWTPATYSRACETRIQRGSTATSAMNETSRIRWSRSAQGSRPSTLSSPSYGVRPRIAFRAVVLPAPLGPTSPRIRPSSTRKSMPSSAMVFPNALRRPRASIQAIGSALLLLFLGRQRSRGRLALAGTVQEIFRGQAEAQHGCVNSRPYFREEFLALSLQQQIACTAIDKHPAPPFSLHQSFVNQLLIAFQDREGIDPILGGDIAHGGQRIAFLENSVEYHRDHVVAKLAVNRLIVVPLTVHPGIQFAFSGGASVTVPASGPCAHARACPPAS